MLELALERASGELELGLQAGPARRSASSSNAPGDPRSRARQRHEQVDELRAAIGSSPAASSIRSIPAAQPDAGVGGPPSCSIRRS